MQQKIDMVNSVLTAQKKLFNAWAIATDKDAKCHIGELLTKINAFLNDQMQISPEMEENHGISGFSELQEYERAYNEVGSK